MIFACCGGGGRRRDIEDDLITTKPPTHPHPQPQPQQEASPVSVATSTALVTQAHQHPPLPTTVHFRNTNQNKTNCPRPTNDTDDDPGTPQSSTRSSKRKMTHHRRDALEQIGSSLQTSWMELVKHNPDAAEQNEIRRAMELSMLDCALVIRNNPSKNTSFQNDTTRATEVSPHQVLGVKQTASRDEIKAAFRKAALLTHPDKGGKLGEFERITVAYRTLMTQTQPTAADMTAASALKSSAHWDNELKEHKDLVAELFASHAANLNENVAKQAHVREILGLQHREAGSTNVNEKREKIRNSCFYLSLAVSYLTGIGALDDDDSANDKYDDPNHPSTDRALISQTALQLKRTIEGAVLQAHPEWATAGLVGEEVQAFSDFLVYCLEDARTILPDWAVAIFDETSGFVDVYKGCQYDKLATDDWVQRAHTLTLRFVPGHYQPLLPVDTRPNLQEILTTLDHEGVFYVVTDGAA